MMRSSAWAVTLFAVAGAVACGRPSAGEGAPPAARLHGLTVAVSGSGKVSSTPQGIDCGAVCAATFDEGVSVVFNAHPAVGWQFSGWSGACAGVGYCAVTLSGDASVSARFDSLPPPPPVQRALTIQIVGKGRITSSGGLDCTATCSASIVDGAQVTLRANPSTGWGFSGWNGACSGTGDCVLTLSSDASVAARFDPLPPPPPGQRALRIEVVGQGRVTSSAGLDCTPTCTTSFADGTRVTLDAAAFSGWQFFGWAGACAGSAASCTLTLTADATASATFIQLPPPPPPVSVSVTPSAVTLATGGAARFTASVDGIADQSVLWSATEGLAGGSIDGAGAYTAPASAGTYHVVAMSKADPGKSATAVVTVTSPPPPAVTVSITPASIAAPSNAMWRFTAQVTGASDTSVTWSVREGSAGGTIDANGWYISPLTSGEYHVVATSKADPSASAMALVRTDTPLVDQGGPVQPAAVVYAIWWGSPSVFADAPTQLATLFSSFEGSAYLRTLDQYMRGGKATVSFAGNFFDSRTAPPTFVTTDAIGAEICGLLDANSIAPMRDAVYAVFVDNFPSNSSSWHGLASCHGLILTVAYILNIDAGSTQPESLDVCGRSQMVDGFSMAIAHELFEAMTDPTGKGWQDKANAFAPEISDKCAIPTFTCRVALNNGSAWLLPYMWSNSAKQCVLETP